MGIAVGTSFDRYEIISLLGKGGMGEVYLARDTRLGRRIALKLLPAQFTQDPDRVRRFVQEAKAASALNHPNIITIHEIGEVDGTYFIATEFIDGQTLRQQMASGPMKVPAVLEIAAQVAAALSAAHGAGIIHRDIKPDNVMARTDGFIKVLDFGLAKLTEKQASSGDRDAQTTATTETDPGRVMGTAQYMSPEQARGQKVDARTDIFSLGALLYEMIAGKGPFTRASTPEVFAAILEREPAPLTHYAAEVPRELTHIVSKALRKDRDERYQTVKDLLIDVKDLKQDLEFEARLELSIQPDVRSVATAVRISGQATVDTLQAEVAPNVPAAVTDLRVNKDSRHRQLDLSDTTKSQMPRNIKPMPCTLVEKPFGRPNWIFEIKWDGYRAIAEVTAEEVRLYSRTLTSLKPQFPAIVRSLEKLGLEAVLDGEIVVIDEEGKSRFELFQKYQRIQRGRLMYYVFDLLYLEGHDLRNVPLLRRKALLKQILPSLPHLAFGDHIEEKGMEFFDLASEKGLEGIIAKDARTPYVAGRKNPYWLKIKSYLSQEAVIGGFTEPQGSRQHFGSLVLGVYEGRYFIYIGHSGGGFSHKSLAEIRAKLEPLTQEKCPFREAPKLSAKVHWVRPKLVCQVKFLAWNNEGRMNHPIFLGMREDKSARAVRREKPAAGAMKTIDRLFTAEGSRPAADGSVVNGRSS